MHFRSSTSPRAVDILSSWESRGFNVLCFSFSRIEPRLARELLPQFTFRLRDPIRHFDAGHDNQIAMIAAALRQAATAHAKLLAVLRAWRNLDVDPAIEGGNRNVSAQHRFPRRQS